MMQRQGETGGGAMLAPRFLSDVEPPSYSGSFGDGPTILADLREAPLAFGRGHRTEEAGRALAEALAAFLDLPACALCGAPFEHGCNTGVCSWACEERSEAIHQRAHAEMGLGPFDCLGPDECVFYRRREAWETGRVYLSPVRE